MIIEDLHIGQIVIAFNGAEWQKTGDIGNNQQFYQEATIVDIHTYGNMYGVQPVVDLKFVKSGKMDYGVSARDLRKPL